MSGHRTRLGGVEYLFCDGRRAPDRGGRRLSDRELRSLLIQHRSSPRLRAVLEALDRQRSELNRHHRRDRAAHRLEAASDQLRCYELASPPPRVSPMVIAQVEPPARPQPFAPNQMFDEQAHYFELAFIGEDDEAVAGVVCEITLPNGKLVRRTTNSLGIVRIEGITAAGACTVVFPELDEEAWERA
ncbi:hypothetical protein ENSA5_09060 [Enhygromyxa salina]|uniref:Uncharacterized protein n=1 Tax=Enhygromyxa salina TaxID=215803 RepID=A0A2S9YGM0_9BACT|nr:hypothetical protein [Enhygromyxa salina]PRQ04257.1 hypothetical protein ENSA5_09060 [Enhygromyxa salina]